jgi:hypothetical protein
MLKALLSPAAARTGIRKTHGMSEIKIAFRMFFPSILLLPKKQIMTTFLRRLESEILAVDEIDGFPGRRCLGISCLLKKSFVAG